MANLIDAQLTGDLVRDLAKFEQSIKDKVLFTGVATMARVLYDEVKLNASPPRIGYKTGNLQAAIYRVYSPEKSTDSQKTYRISYNKRKAPHGHLIEFGRWRRYQEIKLQNGTWITFKNRPLATPVWVPATPFVRPAFDHVREAISQGKAAMAQRLQGGAA